MQPANTTKWLKPTIEYGPLVIFFITYLTAGIFPATAAIVISTVLALLLSYIIERHIPTMPLITAVLIVIFGGLTLWLRDETFIKMKPTILQFIFGALLLGGLYTNRIFLKLLMGSALPMDDVGWRILTQRLAFFFFAMGALNEIVWRTQSTDFWVNFKVFGIAGLTILFLVAQTQLLKRYFIEKKE